jgi:streptomycin 6-kinase
MRAHRNTLVAEVAPASGTDQRWLDQLPVTLSECAERWQLVIEERLSGGLVAHVFGCTTRSGEQVVLKLNPPSAAEHAGSTEQQAAALRAWAGRGAIELLDVALDLDAFLTRRAVPGTSLEGNDEDAIPRLAEILGALFDTPTPAVDFAPLVQVADAYLANKMAIDVDSRVPAFLLEAARTSARTLALSSSRQVLLHGDVMDKNLLLDHGRLVAIDPAPCVGDPHADIGFWAATRSPVSGLENRVAGITGKLGLDRERALRWAAVYAVGEACESWRHDLAELRNWVGSNRVNDLLMA